MILLQAIRFKISMSNRDIISAAVYNNEKVEELLSGTCDSENLLI